MGAPKDSALGAGHLITLLIGGKRVGGAKTVRSSQDFGIEPAHIIGDIMPVENVPMRWQGGIELEKFYIRKNVGVQANVAVSSEGILKVDLVDVEVIDKETDRLVFKAIGCVLESASHDVTANAFSGESASLRPLRIEMGEIDGADSILPTGLSG